MTYFKNGSWRPSDSSPRSQNGASENGAYEPHKPAGATVLTGVAAELLSTLAGVVRRQQREIDMLKQIQPLMFCPAPLDPPDDSFAGIEDALSKAGTLEHAKLYLKAVIIEELRQRAAEGQWDGIYPSQADMCEIAGINPPATQRAEADDAAA